MSHHDPINDTASAGCCDPAFSDEPDSALMKDPWECYEGDTDSCAPAQAEETEDCGCCCC